MNLNKDLEKINLDKTIDEDENLIDLTKTDQDFIQEKGHIPRQLTEDEIEKLKKDTQLVYEFKQKKIEQDAKKNWDLFYRRNKAKFFKDRYWTFREFDELNEDFELCNIGKYKNLLEIGCGVGNFIFPLIKQNKKIFVFACDFSTDAIALLKSNPSYDENRCFGFVCDITKENSLQELLPAGTQIDLVTLIFVLSAIHPSKMRIAVENISKIIRPGGMVLVRDYGVYDHSMIRFEPGHKLDDNFYVRQDGTRTFFFSLEHINSLFLEPFTNKTNRPINENQQQMDIEEKYQQSEIKINLFEKSCSEYVFRETINVKENLRVPRVFVQSKFIRTNFNISF